MAGMCYYFIKRGNFTSSRYGVIGATLAQVLTADEREKIEAGRIFPLRGDDIIYLDTPLSESDRIELRMATKSTLKKAGLDKPPPAWKDNPANE